jgi:flagellar basal body-associated protein FliL
MAPFARKKRSASADDPAGPRSAGKVSTMAMSAVLVLAGAAGHRYLLAGDLAASAAVDPAAGTTSTEWHEEVEDPHAALADAEVVTLDDLTINLADPGQMRYLRVGIGLLVPGHAEGDGGHGGGKGGTAQDAWSPELPKARAAAVRYFSQKTMAELQGPEAIDRTATELAEVLRQTFGAEKVSGVLFTSFVMQ